MTQTSNIKSEPYPATFNPCETSTMIQQLQSTLDFRDVKLIASSELQTTTRVCAAFESAKPSGPVRRRYSRVKVQSQSLSRRGYIDAG